MSFTHLHLHTQYSLLDGAIRSKELVPYLKADGQTACAITDHGFMGGVVDFYKACKAGGIKPLEGVEAYITDDEDDKPERTRDNHHLILIAKNNEGYRTLLQLCSEAALHNFYYKPRIHKHKLARLRGNAICTSACLAGGLAKRGQWELNAYGQATVFTDPTGDVSKQIDFLSDIFGSDLYLELQDWDSGDHRQAVFNSYLLVQAQARSLPCVITSDAHYLRREDYQLHEMLMSLQFKKTLEEYRTQEEMRYGPYFYVKTQAEMLEACKKLGCEEAFYNTEKIADLCQVEIELGVYKSPTFNIEAAEDFSSFLKWKEKQK